MTPRAVSSDRFWERFIVPALLSRVDDARRWSSGLARRAAVPEDTIQDLELAVTEALSNTIRHGYGEDPSQRIELSLEISPERIAFSIVDRGRPLDPSRKPDVDLDHPREGGYGLFLIEQLTDEVSRTPHDDGGTLVTLVKYRKEH